MRSPGRPIVTGSDFVQPTTSCTAAARMKSRAALTAPRLLQAAAISPDDEPRLHPYPPRVAVGIGPEMRDHVLDEFGQLEALEKVGELVVLDSVDGGEVLHQVAQAGGAAVNPVDQCFAGFLVQPVSLVQQGIGLGLDAGQGCLQLMGHHRNEVGAHLVDLLQPLHPLFFERFATASLIELGGTLDRCAQRAVESAADIANQKSCDQRHEEKQEDAADHESGRRRDPGKARQASNGSLF